MGGTKGYRSYRGRTSKGKIALAVLLVLIILAAVGPAAPGDRLVLPETHGGGRSIKRLCMDRRISLPERDRLPAVYAGGCLAAVWRLGVDMALAAPEGEPCRFIQITEAAKERDLI